MRAQAWNVTSQVKGSAGNEVLTSRWTQKALQGQAHTQGPPGVPVAFVDSLEIVQLENSKQGASETNYRLCQLFRTGDASSSTFLPKSVGTKGLGGTFRLATPRDLLYQVEWEHVRDEDTRQLSSICSNNPLKEATKQQQQQNKHSFEFFLVFSLSTSIHPFIHPINTYWATVNWKYTIEEIQTWSLSSGSLHSVGNIVPYSLKHEFNST